ncbi:MAG: hypothetical protein LBR64_04090 [Dysgonamonadaceae bacterium]|jgi:hypothetical protein|nr:hypothetical protein [Dysgonamonadaceae bacterium]
MIKKIFILLIPLFLCGFAQAQDKAGVETVFQTVGKQNGSIMIELAKDVLGERTRITRYRSLIANTDSTTLAHVQQTLENEVENGYSLMESRNNGRLETRSYCRKNKEKGENEYLLFSLKSGKLTLIYLRGKIPPDELEDELDNLKNLFIKVNNKTIKLK